MTRRKFAFFAFSSAFSTRKANNRATIKKTATEPPNRSERHCSAAGLPSAPPSAIPRPRIDSSAKEKAWPQRRAVWLPAILVALRPPSRLLLLDGATSRSAAGLPSASPSAIPRTCIGSSTKEKRGRSGARSGSRLSSSPCARPRGFCCSMGLPVRPVRSSGALGRSFTRPPSRPESARGKRSRAQKPLRAVGVFRSKDARRLCALKSPASGLFGLLV